MARPLFVCGPHSFVYAVFEYCKNLTGQDQSLICIDQNNVEKASDLLKQMKGKTDFIVISSVLEIDPIFDEVQDLAKKYQIPTLVGQSLSVSAILRLFEFKEMVDTLNELEQSMEAGKPYGMSFFQLDQA